LETDPRLTDLLNQIDQRTPTKPMSIEKKLDFILWALGGIIELLYIWIENIQIQSTITNGRESKDSLPFLFMLL
jgi:hypothetical protein